MLSFSSYNIQVKQSPSGRGIAVTGDVRNESTRNFQTAVFRLAVSANQQVLSSVLVKVTGFRAKTTRTFEALVEEVDAVLIPKISACELMLEAAY